MTLGSVSDAITVEAATSGSIAAQHAPMDGLLEAHSARTEITPLLIQNFTSPLADFGELVEMAPGTFSISTDGIGLGQDKTYFRGFPDGDYDIDFDGVPFYDTNTPTHHTWAFFPDPWTGSVDFDRSPGTASTIGPTPFGGSIHLLSPDMAAAPLIQGSVSYGSFNTELYDLNCRFRRVRREEIESCWSMSSTCSRRVLRRTIFKTATRACLSMYTSSLKITS